MPIHPHTQSRPVSPGDILLAIAAFAGIFGLKLWYRTAPVDELIWILSPTAKLVGLASGQSFIFLNGVGFQRWDELIVINKGCSGVNFLVIACSLALYVGMPFPGPLHRKIIPLLRSILIAFCLTIAANTARILTAAAILEITPRFHAAIPGDGLHLAVGIVVYMSVLIAFYFLLQRIQPR